MCRGKPVDLAHASEPEKANTPHLYYTCREEYSKPSFTDALHTADNRQKSKEFFFLTVRLTKPLEFLSSKCTLCCKPVTAEHQVLTYSLILASKMRQQWKRKIMINHLNYLEVKSMKHGVL